MSPESKYRVAAGRVPDLDRGVIAGRGQAPAVRAEGYAVDLLGVAGQGVRFLAAGRPPNFHAQAPAPGGAHATIGAEVQTLDVAVVTLQQARRLATGGV